MQRKLSLRTIIKLCGLVLILLSIPLTACADSAILTRGPYLQRVSENTVIIRYRTNLDTNTHINFGRSSNNLDQTISDTNSTEHRLEISNLTADTKYYYQILSDSGPLTTNDESYFFITNPIPGSIKPTRIWAIGDSGTGSAKAIKVKQSYLSYVGLTAKPADLWLMLGDNAYNNGLDSEYTAGLFNIYPEILKNTPLWPTLGNHDGYAKNFVSAEIPYYASFSLPRNAEVGGSPSGTESYYSFNYANIHFVCLNSYDEDRNKNAAMASWLKQDLEKNTSKWTIAYWHHSPYTKGNHNSDLEIELIEMREQILPILEQLGVDLVLTGHSHSYERSFLLNGHYGLSSSLKNEMFLDLSPNSYSKPPENVGHFGTIYAVNGVAGKISGGTLNHPIMQTSLSQYGSMVIDIVSDRIEAKMIDLEGHILDTFAISKEKSSSFVNQLEITSGKVIGELSLLAERDLKSQRLIIPKTRIKKQHLSTYRFEVPKNFYKTKIIFNAHKNHFSSPNFRLSYSLDGKTFQTLSRIKSYKDHQTKVFTLEGLAGQTLLIRISSVRKPFSNHLNGSLILDQLKIEN